MLRRALPSIFGLFVILLLPGGLSAAGIPITGRVVDPSGKPAAAAAVALEPIRDAHERARLRLGGEVEAAAVRRGKTDAEGAFEIVAPEAGMWTVVVTTPGYLTMEFRLIPLIEATELPLLELFRATELELKLVDAEGTPRPATVGMFTLNFHQDGWRPLLRLLRTGDDGVARLPQGGREEKFRLEALADGFPLVQVDVIDETSVSLDLAAGVALTVRVTDHRGRPLAGAIALQGNGAVPLGQSDAEGLMSLVVAAKQPPRLRVTTADGWNGSFDLDPETLAEAAKAEDAVMTLRLEPSAVLSGRVLDLATRDPLPGAMVWVERGRVARTDARGRYDLGLVGVEPRYVQAAAVGYQTAGARVQGPGGDGPTVALAPTASVSGRVIDGEGTPLPGVEIAVELAPGSLMTGRSSFRARDPSRVRSSRQGTFTVAGLSPEAGYELTFEKPGFAPRRVEVGGLGRDDKRAALEVVLVPGRRGVGRVVGESGEPVAGAEIVLREPPPAVGSAMIWGMARNREEAGGFQGATDGEGRFEVRDLAVGRYDLEVRARGFAPATVPGLRVEEGAGEVDFGTVTLVPGAVVEGRVTGPEGRPIAGAEVTLHTSDRFAMMARASGPEIQATSDAAGRFVVGDLSPGKSVALSVTKKGYGTVTVSAVRPPTEEPVQVVLRPSGRLAGRVLDPRGGPVEGAAVNARPEQPGISTAANLRRQVMWARSDADGRFLIEDVDPSPLTVTVEAPGYQSHSRSGIEMPPGGEVTIDVVLEPGAVVEGRITRADGEPVFQALVTVSARREGIADAPRSGSGQSDAEGRYRVDGVPPGPATLDVYYRDRQQPSRNLEVRPGGNVVDVVLEGGFEITGQVTDPQGSPVSGAAVSIQQGAGFGHVASLGAVRTVSAADGSFSLRDVVAGQTQVIAIKEGFAQAQTEPFELAADVSGLLLRLGQGATVKGRILNLDFDELGSLTIMAYSQEGGIYRGRVDFSSAYEIDNVTPGQWHVQAQVAGSGRSTFVQVEVPEGVQEVVKDLEFSTGVTLSGVVIDGGEPLAGANVIAAGGMSSMGQVATGADGRFRIEHLAPGSYQLMVMSNTGSVQHIQALELAADDDVRIEISTGRVTGVLRDAASGEPVAGAAVSLEKLDVSDLSAWASQLGTGSAQSDSRGRFNVPQVRQGSWRVVATKPGYAPGEVTIAVAGGSPTEVEILMRPTEGVTFTAVLESGAALAAVQVAILGPGGRRLTTGHYPAVGGKVEVAIVPPGRWELVVQGGDSAATRFTVDSPGDQGTLRLPVAGTLTVTVPDLAGEVMANLSVTGPDGKPFIAPGPFSFAPGEWMLSGGRASIPFLTPGVWSLTATHPDGRTWSGSATVTAGATTEVSLQ